MDATIGTLDRDVVLGTPAGAVDSNETGKPHNRGCIVSFAKLRAVLAADLYRYAGRTSAGAFAKHYLFTPGFKYTVLMRTAGWLRLKPAKALGLYPLAKLMLLRARYKYGFAIPEYTEIGPGLFLNRFGGFYFHGDAKVGSNVNVTHGVVLGFMLESNYRRSLVLSGGDHAVFIQDPVALGLLSVAVLLTGYSLWREFRRTS